MGRKRMTTTQSSEAHEVREPEAGPVFVIHRGVASQRHEDGADAGIAEPTPHVGRWGTMKPVDGLEAMLLDPGINICKAALVEAYKEHKPFADKLDRGEIVCRDKLPAAEGELLAIVKITRSHEALDAVIEAEEARTKPRRRIINAANEAKKRPEPRKINLGLYQNRTPKVALATP